MLRLSHRRQWFERVSKNSLSEAEFENVIKQNVELVRPKTISINFKKIIFSRFGASRPDLAFIKKDYSSWAIVEIEMLHHSLFNHVIPQVRNFVEGRYPSDLASHLSDQNSELDALKLAEMTKGVPPEVIVIANGFDTNWKIEIERIGATFISFEIFRSPTQTASIFLIDGAEWLQTLQPVSILKQSTLPRFLQVASPATLEWEPGENFEAVFDGQVLTWERVDTANQVFIRPIKNLPIQSGESFRLVKLEGGQYEIQPY
jgi:hypothetical protein